ncbi:CHY_zinc finger domain-containing protein [Hexamita inflata]|uniref:CHY zinc finger domain-containing protein n=1 Tax=Hexamita inflata TaxID=28002 RepID=A0AA86PNV1_9EUKA|nr:CHY zinc finger domain-containing protein [Hexamita inflata]
MYPSASLVSEQHRNKIIVSVIFKIKEHGSVGNKDDRIILKRFPSDIFNQDNLVQQQIYVTEVTAVMPLVDYHPDVNHMECVEQFNQKSPTFDSTQYQPEELVYRAYETDESVGCEHYICGCLQQCPECLNFYGCRQCHNDSESHLMNRKQVQNLKCRFCDAVVPYSESCANCKQKFCEVSCKICKFMCFIDANEKPFYHCDKCGTCNVGLENSYTHCEDCNACWWTDQLDSHVCCKNRAEKCCVCLGNIKDSIYQIHDMRCGHTMHYNCWSQLLDQNNYFCPVCKKYSLDDNQIEQMTQYFLNYVKDKTRSNIPVRVHCNECQFAFDFFKQDIYFCHKCKKFNTEELQVEGDTNKSEEYIKSLGEELVAYVEWNKQLIIEHSMRLFKLDKKETQELTKALTKKVLKGLILQIQFDGFPATYEEMLAILFKLK